MTAEGDGEAVRVRRMRREDLARVMEIAAGLADAPQWAETAYAAALEPGGAPRRIVLTAETTDGIAGFAVASVVGAQAELETIAATEASQRRGVGSRLLRALAGELKTAGANQVFLEVRASNQRALEFYRRRGFAETGRRPCYYADPVEDAVLMTLRLE